MREMKKISQSLDWLLIFIFFISLLIGCQPSQKPDQAMSLRLAVIPVLDTLPMYVADKEGLFSKYGVSVEFIPVTSAPERDALIASGQADGMVNEALSTAFFNKDQVQVQVIRFARAATAENALFSILAAAQSDIQTPNDLKGVEIGISQGTVIAYLTDRLLQAEGLSPEQIKTIAVPKIDDRMNLLGSGSLQAAMLPEPMTTLAVTNGAHVVLDDSIQPELSYSVISFRKQVIDENPKALVSFLAAIEEAVGMINMTPEKYEDLMVERKVVPASLQGIFKVPPFITAGVPSEEQWTDMIRWAVDKGLLQKEVPYSESVNPAFLPK
jgi:NitT/TauT family transport system substrate-binding protein